MKPLTTDEARLSETDRGRAVFGLLAILPIAAVLIPWDFGLWENQYRQLMAGHSLPTILIELLIFIAFFKNEDLVSDFIKQANRMDKIVGTVFLSAIIYSFLFVSASKMLLILGSLALLIHLLFSVSLFKNMKYVGEHRLQCFWIFLGVSVIGYTALWAIDFLMFPPAEIDWVERVPGVTNVRWTGFFWLSIFAAGLALARVSGAKYFFLAVIFGSFGLMMTLWTGTRGSFIAIVCGALGAVILSPAYRKFIVKYCLASAVIAIVINIYAPVPHQQYGMERVIFRLQPEEVVNRGGTGRIELWKETARLAQIQLFVGYGIDQFQKMGPAKTLGFKGPHSFPLQLFFSAGLIGLLTLFYGIWRFLGAYRLEVQKPYQVAAVTFFSGGCVYLLYDNFAYYPYSIAIFTLSIFMLFKQRSPLGS
ncbi:O-antigen ligase family protein [Parasphingorhabdus sp.]|uniref:O-antigen ligase family protein n=1 Tax=Parasphingorhabdus sp. TaxID=2709688 RepID=UPI0032669715